MTRVLVTGVRGKTGIALAGLLAGRDDVEVRGGSTDPASVRLDGVDPVAFSWDRPSGWAAALEGVDAVFLVRPDRPDAPELVEALLPATASRTRVVLLSERSADGVGPGIAGWASRVERAVRADGELTGRTWTVLRPGWFFHLSRTRWRTVTAVRAQPTGPVPASPSDRWSVTHLNDTPSLTTRATCVTPPVSSSPSADPGGAAPSRGRGSGSPGWWSCGHDSLDRSTGRRY